MKPSDFRKQNPDLSDTALALAYALSPLDRAKKATERHALMQGMDRDYYGRENMKILQAKARRKDEAIKRRAAFHIVKTVDDTKI